MTTDWRHYVSASYNIVAAAETNLKPKLDQTLEAYLVHLLAKHFREHSFGSKPVAISLMESMNLPGMQKKQALAEVGDECLFISGFEYNKSKWPSASYYQDIGTMAYGYAYIATNPKDVLYSHLEENFTTLKKVLSNINKLL